MKKTLITLAALAAAFSGAASAADSNPLGVTWDSGYVGDFTFTFTLPQNYAVSSDAANPTILAGYYSSQVTADWDKYSANAFTLVQSADGYTLTAGRGRLVFDTLEEGGLDYSAPIDWVPQDEKSVSSALTLNTGVLYEVRVTNASGMHTVELYQQKDNGTFEVVDLNGSADGTALAAYKTNMNGGSITGSYLNPMEVSTGGAIPEPTTATLSLLALAGLAARRRRK